MNRILEVDAANMRAVVQPGVVNQTLSDSVAHLGLLLLRPIPPARRPAPSAETWPRTPAGLHTLMYGQSTVNHVTGLEVVLPDGEIVHSGGKAAESAGYGSDRVLCRVGRNIRNHDSDYGEVAASSLSGSRLCWVSSKA